MVIEVKDRKYSDIFDLLEHEDKDFYKELKTHYREKRDVPGFSDLSLNQNNSYFY